jgi:hypothetical protein
LGRTGLERRTEGICLVSQLYDMKVKIEAKIKAEKLDENEIKGKIGLKAGKLLAFITASTVDDVATIAKMKQAAKEVLNLSL